MGESIGAWRLSEQLAGVAPTPFHIMLTGESGSGKEVAARALHAMSDRADRIFIARNAATFPPGLIDAELFGSAKNFPNAGDPERPGLFGVADGGTFLLDEVGELPEAMQASLLRVADPLGEYQRLGESKTRRTTARIIAATNRDFRTLKHDLVARFSTRVHVPGLNYRRSDIPFLVDHLLRSRASRDPNLAPRYFEPGKPPRPRVDARLLEALLGHHYTTNIRELAWLLDIAIQTSPGNVLTLTNAVSAELRVAAPSAPVPGQAASTAPGPSSQPPLSESGARRAGDPTAAELSAGLERNDGNVSAAARDLGIGRNAVYRLLNQYGLRRRG